MRFQAFCVEERDLLWRWNPILAHHKVIASTNTALFRFQIAMLVTLMRA